MGIAVTFDEPASTVRVKQSGEDCDLVEAMNAFEAMHADPRFRRICKLLVDLSECHGERTPPEVEAFVGYLAALFRWGFLAFVTSAELERHLVYAIEIIGGNGMVGAQVFATPRDAEGWLRGVH